MSNLFSISNLWVSEAMLKMLWNIEIYMLIVTCNYYLSYVAYFVLNNKIIHLKLTLPKIKQVCIIINRYFFLPSNMNNKGLSHTLLCSENITLKIIINNNPKYNKRESVSVFPWCLRMSLVYDFKAISLNLLALNLSLKQIF